MIAGDVLFYSGADPVSAEIQGVTRSRYCHVALALCADYLIEAVPPRVRVARLTPDVVARAATPSYAGEAGLTAALAAALAVQHDTYDAIGAGVAGAGDVLRAHLAGLGHAVDAIEAHLPALRLAVFCSRLVARALVAGGMALPQPPDYCSPGDLAAALTGQR